MTKVMAAHQSNFLPYLGFFDKMRALDEMGSESGVFVLRSDAQFVRKRDAFHSRNKLRTYDGWSWIYVPVENKSLPISDISIKTDARINNVRWNKYHMRLITQLYKKTPYFNNFFPELENIYSEPEDKLDIFNTRIIKFLAKCFGINTKIISIYDLPSNVRTDDASETLANIAKAVNADVYLSGPGGKTYLDPEKFGDVKLEYQNFVHPVYSQRWPGFESNMASIDALFNIGYLPR